MIEAFEQTKGRESTELVFVLDDNDVELPNYSGALLERPLWADYFTVPNEIGGSMVAALNYAAVTTSPYSAVIGFMGDDHRPRTQRWDVKISDELASKEIVLAYGNDLLQGHNLPTAVFMKSFVIEALGWMAPPVLKHMYADNFWYALGATHGMSYMGDVIIEHLHPIANKAKWDDGYRRADSFMGPDQDAWNDFRNGPGYLAAVQDVAHVIGRKKRG
jgi:hypothetical protein